MKDGKYSIRELADKFSLNCNSLSSALLRSEFKDKYYEYYSFPVQQMQNKVYEIIQTITDKQIIQNDKKVISPYELDIYIPDLNFAIEFNGSYWHSEATIPHEEARVKHCNKTKLCENKGIRLFHIFENEWKSRSTQILNFIKTIVGSNAINIAARKCQLKIEDPIVNSKDFMDNNHIQGHTTAIKYFNLYYNDEIVASMSAAKHHRQGQDAKTIVLSRLCMKDGYNVQGGPSKLFKAFKQWSIENGYNRVLSWSDNCWTQGRIYNVLGFRLDIEFGPDYFYWSPIENRYYSKQSQKKSATGCPKEIKEHEWCASKGLYRIWDCGKKRWIFEL
jgi:hypothetical protein